VEGTDQSRQRPRDKYHEKGKTASLLLRLYKPLFVTDKVVILDSVFCVLVAILALKQYGMYLSVIIKKRQYWPAYIPAEAIYCWFEGKVVGESHRLPGDKQGIKFDVFS